jgi:hypothetical protein
VERVAPNEDEAITSKVTLAFVENMEPENEVQAALAVNAACLQAASTNLLSRMPRAMGERAAGITRISDRDQRRAERHQPIAKRAAARAEYDC